MPLFENFDDVIFDALGDVDAVHTQTGNSIKGVFENEYYEAFDHATRSPVLTIQDQASPIARGDTFTINTDFYKVVDIEPDGTGIRRLQLSKLGEAWIFENSLLIATGIIVADRIIEV